MIFQKENLDIVATAIVIITGSITIFAFFLNNYIKKRAEIKRIKSTVNDKFIRWKELDYCLRGHTQISNEDFYIINKNKKAFSRKNNELNAFLLINAIQNGAGGLWGKWLTSNAKNKMILKPLLWVLDESAGVRLVWRSALILEELYKISPTELKKHFPETDNQKLNENLLIIKEGRTHSAIKKVTTSKNVEIKNKANMVLSEYRIFKKDIEHFINIQEII